MRFELNIDYSPEKMELSRQRLEARTNFTYIDRVPVGFCLEPRYFTPKFNLPYSEIFKDVETQYYWLLQFAKFRIENVPEDLFCTSPAVAVYPYFDNVINPSAFGAEVVWPENETLQTLPTIKSVEAMEEMAIPAPDSGLWGKVIQWHQRMTELARETKLTFNGNPAEVVVSPLTIGGLGPHMVAVDLVGTDFYWWVAEYPEACKRFLEKITLGLLQAERQFRGIDPRPHGGFGMAEDSAQIMSAGMFREFVVPYDNRLYDELGKGMRHGRGMHMCGDSAHLHEALVKDLRITSFDIFGYRVKPETAAKNLGGKALLFGNIDPMLMLSGTKAQVKAACREALAAMAPCGGLILGDGANVCPGTPLENLAVFVEAAEEYGLPKTMNKRRL